MTARTTTTTAADRSNHDYHRLQSSRLFYQQRLRVSLELFGPPSVGRGLGQYTSLFASNWPGSVGHSLPGQVSAMPGESRPSPPHVFEEGGWW